jgi:RNA-binding protein Tab2/Atab2
MSMHEDIGQCAKARMRSITDIYIVMQPLLYVCIYICKHNRPVVGKDGKKLWELLLCDNTGSFKHVERIPSNMVNSREVRKAVERVIDTVSNLKKTSLYSILEHSIRRLTFVLLQYYIMKDVCARAAAACLLHCC